MSSVSQLFKVIVKVHTCRLDRKLWRSSLPLKCFVKFDEVRVNTALTCFLRNTAIRSKASTLRTWQAARASPTHSLGHWELFLLRLSAGLRLVNKVLSAWPLCYSIHDMLAGWRWREVRYFRGDIGQLVNYILTRKFSHGWRLRIVYLDRGIFIRLGWSFRLSWSRW